MKKRSGIYCIENIANGKKYIGQSVNLKKRKKDNISHLDCNSHHNNHLQNSYNKYGKENFTYKILLYCEPFELTRYEQFFVDSYSPEVLYNKHLECVNSPFGTKHTEEAKKKMSKTRIEKKTAFGKNNPMYGKHHLEESKKKMSEAKTGENNFMYGKKHLEKTKSKISKANSGENNFFSKLTEKEVLNIYKLLKFAKLTRKEIAGIYSVHPTTIYYIETGKTWKNLYKKYF